MAGRGSNGKEYWVCDGCGHHSLTEILAEKHEKHCELFLLKEVQPLRVARRQRVERLERAKERAKARSKETEVPSEVNKVSSSSVTEVPRHTDRSGGDVADGDGELREASGFIFFIGVILLLGALLFPTEDVTEECGVQPVTTPEEIQDYRDCMESVQSQMNVVKWLGGLGVIFCFIGIFTKIR